MNEQGDEGGHSAYDLIEYPSYPYAITHPDNLATIAVLFSMAPVVVTGCRVLEIGCGRGGNLIPMAFNLPESHFVGVDNSPAQIDDGARLVEQLGLSNIELMDVDLCSIGPELGEFDYIICHGVYSWVSKEARDQILRICGQSLASNGVACVSYNIYPGWNEAEMLRGMFQRLSDEGLTPAEKVAQAREMLKTLHAAVLIYHDTRAQFLEAELKRWGGFPDGYIYFEFLEGENHPTYFTDFIKHAQQHGLQYLGNGRHASMDLDNQPPDIARLLKGCRNIIEAQQYLDFLSNKRFRTTLLCPAQYTMDRNLRPERVFDLNIRADVEPDPAEGPFSSNESVSITTPAGIEAEVKGAANRHALSLLRGVYPEAIPFEVLFEKVLDRLGDIAEGKSVGELKTDLATALTHLYFANVVHFHSYQPRLTYQLGKRPIASRLSRCQAERDAYVATQWHRTRFLDHKSRAILQMLDGTNSRGEIEQTLSQLAESGLNSPNVAPCSEEHQVTLDEILETFRRQGLLVP